MSQPPPLLIVLTSPGGMARFLFLGLGLRTFFQKLETVAPLDGLLNGAAAETSSLVAARPTARLPIASGITGIIAAPTALMWDTPKDTPFSKSVSRLRA